MAFWTKVYIVQRADKDGNLLAETPVAAKLTFEEAMSVATMHGIAPAKITLIHANKDTVPNGEGQIGHWAVCQQKTFEAKGKGFSSLDESTTSSLNRQKANTPWR